MKCVFTLKVVIIVNATTLINLTSGISKLVVLMIQKQVTFQTFLCIEPNNGFEIEHSAEELLLSAHVRFYCIESMPILLFINKLSKEFISTTFRLLRTLWSNR